MTASADDRRPRPGRPATATRCSSLDDVHTYYGHIHALQGITLEVDQGEIVTLIGANGAGKTTTLKTISGLLHPRKGTVTFEGKDISQTAAHELVRAGHRPRARGPPHLLPADGPREPPDGRASRRHQTDDRRRTSSGSWTLFPRLRERTAPARRHAVGRRAADAGDRPGADVRAARPAPRRAVAGPRPDPRPADLRDDQGDQRARARRSCSSSRTPSRRCRSPIAATSSRRATSSSSGTGRRPDRRTRRSARRTSARI